MTKPINLPVLPLPQARALTLLQQDEPQISQISETVQTDPSMTSAVLRAANSAASAPVNWVDSADRAIVRIGLDTTRRIVTGMVLVSSFSELQRSKLDIDQLWAHAMACAVITDQAQRASHSSGGFTAGLLHDIGRMAMAQGDPELYAEVVRLVREEGVDAREAEISVIGYDHEESGTQIAAAWNLPDEIVAAIGDHHQGHSSPLAESVRDARQLAHALGYGDGIVPNHELHEGEPELDRDGKLLLSSVGGVESLHNRVDWFKNALSGEAAA